VKKLLIITLLLAAPACLADTVTYDNAASGSCIVNGCDSSGSTALTVNITVGSNSNRSMSVTVTVSATSATNVPNVSTVTCSGQSLTSLIKKQPTASKYFKEIWILPAGVQPSTGSTSCTATLASALPSSASARLLVEVLSVYNVSQTTAATVASSPASNSGTSCSGAGCATNTLGASDANGLTFGSFCSGTNSSASQSWGTTRISQNGDSFAACNSVGLATAAGSVTDVKWSLANDRWINIGAVFAPFVASSGGFNKRRKLSKLGIR
jgi:hypothetical protein